MTNFHEVIEKISGALSDTDPKGAYSKLVEEGMDLTVLSDGELLLLYSRFAGNTCILSRGISPSQRKFISHALLSNMLLPRTK